MRFTRIVYLENIVFIFAQIIYCVCSLKLNHRGDSGERPLKMFTSFFYFFLSYNRIVE